MDTDSALWLHKVSWGQTYPIKEIDAQQKMNTAFKD